MAEIKDFGNKIGGAKKDLWKARGLILDDILDMNDIERNQYIKKDNVWQKPDYQAMVDQGLSKRIVYFIKTIRDGLPAKPQRNTKFDRKAIHLMNLIFIVFPNYVSQSPGQHPGLFSILSVL